MSLLFKFFLSSASWFLVTLISIVILWSFFVINQNNNLITQIQNQTISVQVLSNKDSSFESKDYSVLWNNQTWVIKNSLKNLKAGNYYQIETKSINSYTNNLQTNSFDKYNYSLGIQGEIKILESKGLDNIKILNCNFYCFLINNINQVRVNFQNQLLINNCHSNYFIIQILNQDPQTCKNNSYLGYGLILGGSNNLEVNFKQNIKKIGLTHLIAFSGFQVVIICSILEFSLLKTGFSRLTRLGITLIILVITITLVGPQPPVLRSSISILLLESILFFCGRKIFAFHRLVYSSLILLVLNPFYLINLSFQLSILATFGLILASSLTTNKSFLAQLVTQTIGAWIMTLPITIALNGQINLIQIISNILIIPVIPVSSLLILLTTIPFIGSFFGFFNNLVLTLLQIFISDLASINQLNFVFSNIKSILSVTDVIFYYSLIIGIWVTIYFQKNTNQNQIKTENIEDQKILEPELVTLNK